MRSIHHGSLFALAFVAVSAFATCRAQTPDAAASAWTHEVVAVGVTLRTTALEIGGFPQTVSLLEVAQSPRGARLALAAPGRFAGTTNIGLARHAVAAVNGGFFDKKGTNVGVLRIGGIDHGRPHPHRTAGVVIDGTGRAAIRADASTKFAGEQNVMTAGPLLVQKGDVVPNAAGWSKARHPRTAIGVRKDATVLLVTIDGRTSASRGVTLRELAAFMVRLGARSALNLDGGGSTTMWVRGEGEAGIVNYPCDNFRHDREGERDVPNAIVVMARDVVLGATEEATFTPQDAWRARTDGRGVHGADWRGTSATGATARWTLAADFPGMWDVEVRWPRISALSDRVRVACGSLETHVDQTVRGGAWQRVGRITVAHPGPIALTLTAAGKRTIAADAVRLVQRKAPTSTDR